jgi:hypothetical protein
MADAIPIGVAADRVMDRVAMISGFRALLDACPTHANRRALIAAAHHNGALDDQEFVFLLAEAA